MNKNSTMDLHNIKQDIYLGFLAEEPTDKPSIGIESSFFGGDPIWLTQPTEAQQKCPTCHISLCFLGQVYCPFQAQHCYHRVLYVLFCDKCIREFRCVRQQAGKQWQSKDIKSNVRKLCEAREVDNDSYPKADFVKLMARIRVGIEQEEAIEEAESEDEQDAMEEVEKVNQSISNEELKKYQQKEGKGAEQKNMMKQQPQKQQNDKDLIFETYKKTMIQLQNPCLLYTDTPLPYNKRTLNPQHFCPKCQTKLTLQLQITQKVLNMDNDPNSKLLLMDWGSLFVYSCGASCEASLEECLVVQYQIDAVTDQDIKKLNKNRKKKKKQDKKSKSKSKSRSKSKDKEEEEESDSEKNETKQTQPAVRNQGQGDWD